MRRLQIFMERKGDQVKKDLVVVRWSNLPILVGFKGVKIWKIPPYVT